MPVCVDTVLISHMQTARMKRTTGNTVEVKRPRASSIKQLVFPDVLNDREGHRIDDDYGNDHDDDAGTDSGACAWVSHVFFDLANADEVLYRIQRQTTSSCKISREDKPTLVFHQDMSACHNHTGGIIWETSYLLLEYLLELCSTTDERLGRTLELGAGVGFLGQCLAAEHGGDLGYDANQTPLTVLLTETAQVLVNVQANLAANLPVISAATQGRLRKQTTRATKKPKKGADSVKVHDPTTGTFAADVIGRHSPVVQACALDWTHPKTDIQSSQGLLAAETFDTLLGTDVIFAPSLVEPLLQTAALLSHRHTVWYVCVQMRCVVSHQLFLNLAPTWGFVVTDMTESVLSVPRCAWGRALECLVYRITREPVADAAAAAAVAVVPVS